MVKTELSPEHRALLDWAFGLNGRVPLNWSITAMRLARCAALLYERTQDARRLHAEVFGRDGSGLPVAKPRPLSRGEQDL